MRIVAVSTRLILCAACALACNRQSDRETSPPPGQTHATPPPAATEQAPELSQGPAPGPGEMTGMSAEEKAADVTGAESELEPVAGRTGITEANVVANLTHSNLMEVKMGDLIQGKTKNPEVKELGRMLVADHGATLQKLKTLREKLKIEPIEDESVKQMRDEGSEKLRRLEGMEGNELDKAFLDTAIEAHQETLTAIDEEYLPAAKSDELKTLLREVKPTVQKHLDHAKRVRDKIK